ncbi:hypothetical protein [Pseudarthrobacter sp. NamB4]|uniref:hypothetical protein n=1 Tax=Pseudarthrobacter sp. NamB4 TaxID=2576837 RepID=UPI001F0DD336|nr:hypothetical protein [Pseudarthrobacter sp. NamB4]
MTVLPRSGGHGPLTAAQRLRQGANLVNGTTLLGLAVAVAARTDLAAGPRGLLIAGEYRWRLPFAGAFTLGNVVLCRSTADELLARHELLRHEEKHSSQYAWCLGVPFLPLYFLAAGWSMLRTGNPGTSNVFERHAGLAAGGYPPKASLRHGPARPEVHGVGLRGRRRRRHTP